MPKPRKNKIVQCVYFKWRLLNRDGTWYADGRSNTPNAGRHSLGTKDRNEAQNLLPELDRVRAEGLGLIPRSTQRVDRGKPLLLEEGRQLYEQHIARPRVTGGVRDSTKQSYKSTFDKFIPFAVRERVEVWNRVDADLLSRYANHLEKKDYANKTLCNELTTIKQAIKWMIEASHLLGVEPIKMKLCRAESQPAYCYRAEEVAAMIKHCREREELHWLANIITTLACTGVRIGELVSLRWSDVDLETMRISLTDETGLAVKTGSTRRKLKSGRSRSFPIHPDLLELLQRLPRKSVYLFPGPRDGQLRPSVIRKALIREVIKPLSKQFPTPDGQQGFKDGRLHSFRHYFCSTCANNGVPERMVMDWLGHANSDMIRHYYHLHDEEARCQMKKLNFLGPASGCSASDKEDIL